MSEPAMGRDARTGVALALASAALFGVAAPLSKPLIADAGPVLLASLLYLGAGLGLSGWRTLARPSAEAPVRRADLPLLALIVLCGGVLGPVLMLVGLSRVSALAGSLLLNLEAPFTIGLAVLFLREHLGWREGVAVVGMLGGAALLGLQPGDLRANGWGVLAIAGACLAWGIDNTLTAKLALKDPVALARLKTLGAGATNGLLALAIGARLPPAATIAQALLLGLFSYGISIALAVHAVRRIGAARQAALFSTAPFAGAMLAVLWFSERPSPADLGAAAALAAGAALLARARHAHLHRHAELVHEHLHQHDDHHDHRHGPADPPGEPHSHPHRHQPLTHEHPHLPDAHHRHAHAATIDSSPPNGRLPRSRS